MSFDQLGLDPVICRAVSDAGYKTPTNIQSLAIPEVMAGRDVLASADTGTGKTAAFMLPALHRLMKPSTSTSRGPRILVLTPTRELAAQITNSARVYGKHLKRLRTVSILGGMPFEPQRRDLRDHVDIMVATPGRLLDHHREGRVDFSRVQILVLDEADRMLDMGFYEDVQTISKAAAKDRQTILFSATFCKRILSLASDVTKDAKRIESVRSVVTHDSITQSVIGADGPEHKFEMLKALIKQQTEGQVIVFSATKRGADRLADALYDNDFSALALHGDMRQNKRMQAIRKIRENRFQVLVATDVAARGIDIQTIGLVVNYDMPRTADDYTHRIGRTGRAGASGRAVTFVSRHERRDLAQMQKSLGHQIAVESVAGLEAKFSLSERDMHQVRGGSDRARPRNGGRGQPRRFFDKRNKNNNNKRRFSQAH